MPTPTFILASKSKGRAILLREAGYVFEQHAPPFDDPPHPETSGDPEQTAIAIARGKAESFTKCDLWRRQPAGAVALSGDTLIVHDNGEQAGTPTTIDEARHMIRRFVNTTHGVASGVALLVGHGDRQVITAFADTTYVSIGHVDDAQLEEYLATGAWATKAGGYNLWDRQQAGWPITVEGDPTTVVGLPMQLVNEHLPRLGVRPTRQ